MTKRNAVRAITVAVAVGTLVVPALVLAYSPTAGVSATWSAARFMAMLAFTLLFWNILTGAQAMRFYRYFKPASLVRFHISTGAAGFFLALSHGVLILVDVLWKGHNPIWIFGPVAIGLLALTIVTALSRARLASVWRRIHQINYLTPAYS